MTQQSVSDTPAGAAPRTVITVEHSEGCAKSFDETDPCECGAMEQGFFEAIERIAQLESAVDALREDAARLMTTVQQIQRYKEVEEGLEKSPNGPWVYRESVLYAIEHIGQCVCRSERGEKCEHCRPSNATVLRSERAREKSESLAAGSLSGRNAAE